MRSSTSGPCSTWNAATLAFTSWRTSCTISSSSRRAAAGPLLRSSSGPTTTIDNAGGTATAATAVASLRQAQQLHRLQVRSYHIHNHYSSTRGRMGDQHLNGKCATKAPTSTWRECSQFSTTSNHYREDKIPLKPTTSTSPSSSPTPPRASPTSSSASPSSSSEGGEGATTVVKNPEEVSERTASHVPRSQQQEQDQQESSSGYPPFINNVLARISRISHALNVYTGTDYSGITALRTLISRQERAVGTAYDAVETAKNSHNAAVVAQSARQKEVVQLLERKNSWSAADLERYMALIRREHVEEQAVAETSETLAVAERALEAARVDLERIERKQYHEEQIWSDTIRRNSTWVTIGLMGFNVALLLLSVVVFEPWRRRRIVREVRDALDEKASKGPASTDTNMMTTTMTPLPVARTANGESSDAVLATSAPEIDAAAAATTTAILAKGDGDGDGDDGIIIGNSSSHGSSSGSSDGGGGDATIAEIERQIDAAMDDFERQEQHGFAGAIRSAIASASATLAHAREQFFSDAAIVDMTRRDLTLAVLQSAAVGLGLGCLLCFKIIFPAFSSPSPSS